MAEIKLVVIGQIYNSEGGYAFFSDNANASEAWLSGVSGLDPRDVRDEISLSDQMRPSYSLWRTQYGWYYGISSFNPNDSRSGHAMVVLYVGQNTPSDGRYWAKKLKELLDIFISTERKSDVDRLKVVEILAELEGELVGNVISISTFAQMGGKVGFRRYGTEEELYDILQYPMQRSYERLSRLFIVPSDNFKSLKSSTWNEVGERIIRYYIVKNPDVSHVIVSKVAVSDNEEIEITYRTNDGQSTVKELVSRVSKYYNIDGFSLTIKPLSEVESSLIFYKIINFEVRSSFGKSIDGASITFGGGTSNIINGRKSFKLKKGQYKVSVCAQGYSRWEYDLDVDQCENNKLVVVTLEAKLEEISLRVKYYDKECSGSVYVSADSDLRRPLKDFSIDRRVLSVPERQKMFSKIGFIVLGIVFLVSVVCGMIGGYWLGKKPVKVSNQSAIFESQDSTYIAEHNVWVVDSLVSDKYKTLFKDFKGGVYKLEELEVNKLYGENVKHLLDSLKKCDDKLLVGYLSELNNEYNLEQMKDSIPKIIDSIYIARDFAYLVGNIVWVKSELKSTEYKNFMLGMETGNLKVGNHEELNGNTNWENICALLNKANDDMTKKNAMEASLMNSSASDSINLRALLDDLKEALTPPRISHKGGPGTPPGNNNTSGAITINR